MRRIPEEELERVKRESDLVALVRSRGVELKAHGAKDFIGRCPFHDDQKTANFIVSPAKGLWHCMACGAAGNVLQFVARFDGVSFRHAYEVLTQGGSVAYTPPRKHGGPVKINTVPVLECPLDAAADDQTLINQTLDYYHGRLMRTPSALDYLEKRGLKDDAMLARFRLGFADRTLGLRLPDSNREKGATLRERLTGLGLWRKSGHEHFNGCIVVPILNEAGQVAELYGRRATEAQAVKHLYLPGPHGGIFNAEALQHESGELILCEALFDALTFYVNGLTNVTAIFGTEGFTEELFAAILRHKVRTVRIAYDADDAGERAAVRDTERLKKHGVEVYRIKFPWGMDANEYARKVTPANKSLRLLVGGAAFVQGEPVKPALPVTLPPPADPPEPWELVPVAIAEALAKELGEELKGVAMEVDEDSGEPLPAVSSDSLKQGNGWCNGPYWPAPYGEVQDQQKRLLQMAVERRLMPSAEPCTPAPASSSLLAAELAADEPKPSEPGGRKEAAKKENGIIERDGQYFFTVEEREYRLSGLEKCTGLESLKTTVRLAWRDYFHADALDLCRDMERRRFVERAAEETGLTPDLLKRDLGRLLLAVEQHQQNKLRQERADAEAATAQGGVMLSAEEEAEALAFLRAPNLLPRIAAAFDQCGIVGEETNKLTAYLACVSRLLERPLAVIIQSSSAAGKSTLMDAVLSFFPVEERVKYSAMTGQSLYYLGETNLRHKILAIVEEEGAEKASYALKLLQSEGELTIASTGKDPHTGRMVTQEYRVEGPVMIFLTTTAIDLDEELQNRCLTLSVDESPAQTARIHTLQRERRTLAGLIAREERKDLLRVLRNAQRLLVPLDVLNPYATRLTFESGRTRTRRDHEKYLTLIDSLALLHQHQRPRFVHHVNGRALEAIEVTLEDIATANRLACEVLGRSLDELPPQTRRLYGHIRELVQLLMDDSKQPQSRCHFSRRQLREKSGWTEFQVRVHLQRLEDLEYVSRRFGRQGSSCLYELLTAVEIEDGPSVIGLIDVAKLTGKHGYEGKFEGVKAHLVPPSCEAPHEVGSEHPSSLADLSGNVRDFVDSHIRTDGSERIVSAAS